MQLLLVNKCSSNFKKNLQFVGSSSNLSYTYHLYEHKTLAGDYISLRPISRNSPLHRLQLNNSLFLLATTLEQLQQDHAFFNGVYSQAQ